MKKYLIAILCLLPMSLLAESEGGVWGDVSVSKDLGKRWSLGAEADIRTTHGVKDISRAGIGVDADYKPLKWLKVGVGYSYLADQSQKALKSHYKESTGAFNGFNEDLPYWRHKHRACLDVTAKRKFGRFTLSLRERYQYTHFMATDAERVKYRSPLASIDGIAPDGLTQKEGYYFWPDDVERLDVAKGSKDTHILRSRFGLEYNIRHCPVTPCVSYEIQNRLNDDMLAVKQRATAGIEWKVSKVFYVTADYVYQREFRPEEYESGSLHALSLGFKIKL